MPKIILLCLSAHWGGLDTASTSCRGCSASHVSWYTWPGFLLDFRRFLGLSQWIHFMCEVTIWLCKNPFRYRIFCGCSHVENRVWCFWARVHSETNVFLSEARPCRLDDWNPLASSFQKFSEFDMSPRPVASSNFDSVPFEFFTVNVKTTNIKTRDVVFVCSPYATMASSAAFFKGKEKCSISLAKGLTFFHSPDTLGCLQPSD